MSSETQSRGAAGSSDPVADRTQPFPLPPERRYPLDLSHTQPKLRAFFLETNRAMFDPQADVPWGSFDRGAHPVDAIVAASLVWSRRAWSEFRAIGEYEATLVRMCIENDREADLKYALAAAATDRAGLADACRLVAAALGDYRDGADVMPADVMNRDIIRRALHAETDPDTFFVARLIVAARLDLAEWEAARQSTASAALEAVLDRGVHDKRRAIDAAYDYLGHRLDQLPAGAGDRLATSIADFVGEDIPRAKFSRASDDSGTLATAMTLVAEAGLGAASPDACSVAMAHAGRETLGRLADLGVSLPSGCAPFLEHD